MSRIPAEVNEAVEDRAAGYCECCGLPVNPEAAERHHRKRRGMGGDRRQPEDVAENLVLLHPRCHQWVHAHPCMAREYGLIVREIDDPAEIPVRIVPMPVLRDSRW